MLFSDGYGNWHAVNAIATSKKYFGIEDGGLCAIYISSILQPQLCKHLQCKLKRKILQQVVALFYCKILVFELASSTSNLIPKVLISIFRVVWRQ